MDNEDKINRILLNQRLIMKFLFESNDLHKEGLKVGIEATEELIE